VRELIQAVRDADESWVGHDPEAAGRYWGARGALDAACHPSTIDDDALDAALRAIDAEVHQTQRRMIAALYWRVGVLVCELDEQFTLAENIALLDEAAGVEDVARAMEAACAR
jgi:hypothetical protein